MCKSNCEYFPSLFQKTLMMSTSYRYNRLFNKTPSKNLASGHVSARFTIINRVLFREVKINCTKEEVLIVN